MRGWFNLSLLGLAVPFFRSGLDLSPPLLCVCCVGNFLKGGLARPGFRSVGPGCPLIDSVFVGFFLFPFWVLPISCLRFESTWHFYFWLIRARGGFVFCALCCFVLVSHPQIAPFMVLGVFRGPPGEIGGLWFHMTGSDPSFSIVSFSSCAVPRLKSRAASWRKNQQRALCGWALFPPLFHYGFFSWFPDLPPSPGLKVVDLPPHFELGEFSEPLLSPFAFVLSFLPRSFGNFVLPVALPPFCLLMSTLSQAATLFFRILSLPPLSLFCLQF